MKPKKSIKVISENYQSPSVCKSCGEDFFCGATSKEFWYMNVKISAETRKKLTEKFKNCLCKNCFEKIS